MTPLVVVTRQDDAADPLIAALEAHGLRTWHVPATMTVPPQDDALGRELEHLGEADWLALTSPRAVEALVTHPSWSRAWTASRARVSVASVGPATTAALTHAGVAVALEGPGTGAAALVAALAADEAGLQGRRILWPRSDLADVGWTAALEEEGAQVVAPVAYSTVDVPLSALGALPAAVDAGEVAALAFCSPSSARSVARAFHGSLATIAGHAAIAVLGRTTASTIENLGGRVDVVARRPEAAVLAEDLARFLCARDKGAS